MRAGWASPSACSTKAAGAGLAAADVVVAATQSTEPAVVQELLRGLEVIPPRLVDGVPAIDVEEVLRRHPQVCLIDGLAYRNPPGSKHAERWQDVEELLAAGISVVTSINLQYVKERQAQVEAIRGKVVQDSVPEAFIRAADEIELVDAPPEYCTPEATARMPQPSAGSSISSRSCARSHWCWRPTWSIISWKPTCKRQGIEQVYGAQERILVCLTPRSNASMMIRRGRRQADLFHGDLYAVYVQQGVLSAADQQTIEQNLAAARAANAHVEILTWRGSHRQHSAIRP